MASIPKRRPQKCATFAVHSSSSEKERLIVDVIESVAISSRAAMTTHALARIAPARAPAKTPERGASSLGGRYAARHAHRRGSVARAAFEDSSEATASTSWSPSSGASSERASARAPYAGPPRVVVLGGGFGGLYTALKLDARKDGWKDDAPPRVTLVDRADRFVFKPMLYELVNETMKDWEVCPSFEDLLRPTEIRFKNAAVVDVRPNDEDKRGPMSRGGVVVLDDDSTLEYDYLVVGVGAAVGDSGVPGAAERAVPLNSLEDARVLAGALRDMETKRSASARMMTKNADDESRLKKETEEELYVPKVAVVGGGYSGCELAGVVAERLCRNGAAARVDLFASADGILPSAPRGQRESTQKRLEKLGVTVLAGARATAVRGAPESSEETSEPRSDKASVRLVEPSTRAALAWRGADGDERLEVYDAVCWSVGSTVQCPPSWPFKRCDRSGKIAVDSTLRAAGYDDVFAVGDVARIVRSNAASSSSPRPGDAGFEEYATKESFAAAPPSPPDLPSTAQVAFQQADYASWNVWAAVANKPALPFKYQHIGDMMTTGSFDAAVALPVGDATIDGVAGALLRRAAYLYRMPTDEHRVKLAGAWLVNAAEAVREKGAAGALEEYLGLEVPEELKTLEKMLPKPPGF